MRLDILYFAECPHYRPTVELVHQVGAELGVQAEVREVEILDQEDAERLRFLGSPSVRVDGVDIEPAACGRTEYAVSCRLYDGSGVPPRELLVTALGGPD